MQLFPDGEFAARDGRPGCLKDVSAKVWRMDADIAARLVAQAETQQTPLVVDYEHQTLHAEENGKPAPAAGWITRLAYVPGRGLFAHVEWTAAARAYIAAGEYRYISPVFHFDRASGAITKLLHAALTNFPALDGLSAVAARNHPTEDTLMDKELLAALIALLGLEAGADGAAILAALKTHETALQAALTPDKTPEKKLDEGKPQDKEAAAKGADSDKQGKGIITMPVAALAALQGEIAALTAKLDAQGKSAGEKELDALIAAARADGRLPASLEDWAKGLGKSDPAALASFLAAAKPIAALSRMQTATAQTKDDGQKKDAALSAEDAYAAKQLGIDAATFAKYKEQQ
jgi:phage I-like protein